MGYIAAGFIFITLAIAIVTVFELLPQDLRSSIENLIEEIGGEAR